MSPQTHQNQHSATRNAILDAAESLFVKKGFEGASISAIARAANVTKSLVHHHFGSKDKLWYEVKQRRFKEYFESQKFDLEVKTPDLSLVRDAIVRYFELFRGNPDLVRLISWHIVDHDHYSHRDEQELTELGATRLRQAQEAGLIRKDVDPRYALICFLSLVFHWFQAKHEYLDWIGEDPESKDVDDAYLDTVLKIFFEGIAPREEPA